MIRQHLEIDNTAATAGVQLGCARTATVCSYLCEKIFLRQFELFRTRRHSLFFHPFLLLRFHSFTSGLPFSVGGVSCRRESQSPKKTNKLRKKKEGETTRLRREPRNNFKRRWWKLKTIDSSRAKLSGAKCTTRSSLPDAEAFRWFVSEISTLRIC